MLWLALTARNGGARASSLLDIADKLTALDFDLACALRLQIFENERRHDDFKALSLMLGGNPQAEDGAGASKEWW
jgi:hypothetical protein